MNALGRNLLAALGALSLVPACRAGIPAGLGGFSWSSATPQSGNLHAVAAPLPGTNGVELAAGGDASALIYRSAPLGQGAAGWLCGRGRSVRMNVRYLGVATMHAPQRLAVAADDGTILVGDGCAMATTALSAHALNAVAWSASGSTLRLAIAGDSGAAFTYDDASGKFAPAQVDTKPGGPADIFSLSFPGSGPVGFAAGDVPAPNGTAGVIYRSTDGGQSWAWLPQTPAADAILGVSFVSPLIGFALAVSAGSGEVYFTRDGGDTWQPIAQVDGSMRSIAAADEQHIILVGDAGILVSLDGKSFLPRAEPIAGLTAPIPLEAVDASGQEAWAVGAGGVIFVSKDRGDTWDSFGDTAAVDAAALQDYHAVRFLSDTTALAAGTNGAVLASRDGGASYSPLQGAGGETIFALGAPGARSAGTGSSSPGPALAVGARRTVAALDPATGGITVIGGAPAVDYHAVALLGGANGAKAWAAGQNGTIVFSDADSPVWSRQPTGTAQDLNALQVVPTATGPPNVLAAGNGGVMLRSTDGVRWGPLISGGSITPLPPPVTSTKINGIAFRNPQIGFAAGDAGLLARTGDGGRSWLVQMPLQSTGMLAVSTLPDGSPALETWAVGEHQAVLRSVTDGESWQVLPPPVPGTPGTPPPDFAYRAVQVVGPGVAYIAGDEGHLLQTQDGGATWTELGGTIADTYRALRMDSPATGIAAADSAFTGPAVTLTNDAWRTSLSATIPAAPGPLFGADRLNGEAIVVGAGGFIARSFNVSTGASPDFIAAAADIRAVASPQPGQYVAVGDGGVLIRSIDGGATWQQVPFSNPFGPDMMLRAVAFAVPGSTGLSQGFAGGGVPGGGVSVLLQTADSGQTWTLVDPALGPDAATINGLGTFSNQALAAGANGEVFFFNGQQWSAQRPVPSFNGPWNAVSATDGRWYVAGDAGMSARFPDAAGKAQWQPLDTGTSNDLFCVSGPPDPGSASLFGFGGGIESLRDDIRGYCGDPGTILLTSTGGLPLLGNVTRSGLATAVDVRMVLSVAAGLSLPDPNTYFYGDVAPPSPLPQGLPGDGVLDLRDAALLMRMVMGL